MVWSEAHQCNFLVPILTYSHQSPEGRWRLHLNDKPPGAAAIVMITELRHLRGVALGGGHFPAEVQITMGGQSQVKHEVRGVLEGLGSPFRENSWKNWQLHAPAAAVGEWLRQPHLEAGLALRDTPSKSMPAL